MNADMNFRLSKQRRVILEELKKVTSHPTADEVYDMVRQILPRISLGTVYRNLEFLCTKGLVLKLGGPGQQKRFDGNPVPHPHIRCEICSKIVDVMDEITAPELPEGCGCGFDIHNCNIEFVGVCPECKATPQ